MRRTVTFIAALAMTMGLFASTASASDHGAPWPAHGHIMLLHADYSGEGPTTVVHSYRRCVDLAGGEQLDRAHHTTVHQGRAGAALRGAGHLVLPTAGFTPFEDCHDAVKKGFIPAPG